MAVLIVPGCSRPESLSPHPCRFELGVRPDQAHFWPSQSYSSPPGAYEELGQPQLIPLAKQRVLWGSWYLTPTTQKLYVEVGEQQGWLEVPLPLPADQIQALRQHYSKADLLGVPFRNRERVLIQEKGPRYTVFDFARGQVVWQDQGRYEAPTLDFSTDLLHCHGDLEFRDYIFDSSGTML